MPLGLISERFLAESSYKTLEKLSMTKEDLFFQLLTTVFGAGAGVAVSLYFFRAQQQLDFNRAIEHLDDVKTRVMTDSAAHHQRLDAVTRTTTNIETTIQSIAREISTMKEVVYKPSGVEAAINTISREISAIKTATDVASLVAVQSRLEGLCSSYERLNSEVSNLAGRIVREFTEQQQQFMHNIQKEFAQTVDKSKTGLEQALLKEIAPLIPSVSQQRIIIEKLMDLSGYAMLAMGKYQLEVVESQSSKVLDETGQRVTDSMKELRADITELRSRLEELPKLLSHKKG